MNKNRKIQMSKNNEKDLKNKETNPKRIEWLNIYSKGFIAQSINNNYKNTNIRIKNQNKKFEKKKNIIPINLLNIFSKKGIKSNITSNNLSSNFSYFIDDDMNFYNKYKLLTSRIKSIAPSVDSTNGKEKSKNEMFKSSYKKNDNNINKEKKKDVKYNSLKYINFIKSDKKERNNVKYKNNIKNKHKSIKMNSKISLKKGIYSPLLNYLELRSKNIDKSLFISKKNKNNRKQNKNINMINSYSNIEINITTEKENSNSTDKDNISDINLKKRKKNKIRYSKSIKEITINNINLIQVHKYMIEGRKFKRNKKIYGYSNDYKGEFGDYTFDDKEMDEITLTERINKISFSEVCDNTNNYMTNKKNELNNFFAKKLKLMKIKKSNY